MAEQMGYKKRKIYSVPSGQEIDTGFTAAGAYLVFNASDGQVALVIVGSFVFDGDAIIYNRANISHSFDSDGQVCFNRKEVNGALFINNNYTNNQIIDIIPL